MPHLIQFPSLLNPNHRAYAAKPGIAIHRIQIKAITSGGERHNIVRTSSSPMTSAMAAPNFSFHGLSVLPPPKPFKGNPPFILQTSKNPTFTSLLHHHSALGSVDVSKEDKPLSNNDSASPVDPPSTAEEKKEVENKFDRRRLEERFAVLNTGIYECRSCGFRYDEAVGDPSYPIPPGLAFDKLPEDWRCATCGAAKSFFESKSVEIAGFAQNQNFGFGTNTLTAEQKSLLIYGSLLLAFSLFLSGYFLQ